MRKYILYILLPVIICTSLFIGCNNGPNEDGYSIELDLKKGQHFSEHAVMETNLHESILTTNMNLEIGTDFEVMNGGGGEKEIKMTYTQLHSGLKPDSTETFDSTEDKLHNVMNNMAIGKYVTILLNNNYKVKSISGLHSPEGIAELDTMARKPLDSMAAIHINNFTTFLHSLYPQKRIKIGESWNDSGKITMLGMNMNIVYTYTLASVKEKNVVIQLKGMITGTGNLRINNENMEMALKGEQTGKIILDEDSNMLRQATYSINVKAEADIMGTMLPMDLEAKGEITGHQ